MNALPTWRIYMATLLGVFFEYFDYMLYGFSAGPIARTFFPAGDAAIKLIITWVIFSIGSMIRPLGAIVFGHFADIYGRKQVLTLIIVLMSISTMAIGLLPSYEKIGLFAPLGLLLCRILQGISVSTEFSGCSTYLLEFNANKRGLLSGIITSSSGIGIFSASLFVLIFNFKGSDASWRWAFIIAGLVVGVLGYFLRRQLVESPAYLQAQQQDKLRPYPLWNLLKNYHQVLLQCLLVSAYMGTAIVLIEIYLPSYLQQYYGISENIALRLATFLALTESMLAIAWGAFSDYWGRGRTLACAGILMIISIMPVMGIFHQALSLWWFVGGLILAFLVAAVDGPSAAYLTEQFPTEIRYTAVSLSYSLGAAVIGGFAPSFVQLAQYQFPSEKTFPLILMLAAAVMLVSLRYRKRSEGSFCCTTRRADQGNSS